MVHRISAACLLITLLASPALRAGDVAPIFTIDSSDPVLTVPTARGSIDPTVFIPAVAFPAYAMAVVEDAPYGISYYAAQAIAIVGFTGEWEWRFDGGTWTPITSVSETAPLGLSLVNTIGGNLQLHYAPTAAGTGTLTFRAWDGGLSDSAQSPGSTVGVFSPNGGAGTPFSAETRTLQATVTLTPNNRPVVSGGDAVISCDRNSGGSALVSELIGQKTINDSDGDTLGIAITSIDLTAGNWSYTLGNQSVTISAADFTAPSVLLLPPQSRLSFTPNATLAPGTLHLVQVRAWDQTFGQPGPTGSDVDTLLGQDTWNVDIDAVNNSPTWHPTTRPGALPDVAADAANPPWQRLSDLIGPSFLDYDGDDIGMAVIGVTGTGWQIANDMQGGPDGLPDAAPRTLDANDIAPTAADLIGNSNLNNIILRYLPGPADQGGATRSLSIRAWDQTSNSTNASNPASGGAFSTGNGVSGLASIAVTVTPTPNHPPAWDAGAEAIRPQNLPAVLANAADPIWQRLDDLIGSAFLDADGDPAGVAITAVTGSGWEWSVDVDDDQQPDSTPTAIPAGTTASAAVLLSARTSDNVIVRYRPILADGGQTRTLTIRAWDQTSGGTDASNPTATGAFSLGSGASGLAEISVAVTALPNTPPVVQPVTSIIAVAGQSWQVLVTVSDANDDSSLSLAFDSAVPSDVVIGQGHAVRHAAGTAYRSFAVSGSPANVGIISIALRGNDGAVNSSPVSFTVTVIAAGSTTLTAPVSIAASTPANPVYGAIAPGSTANFQAINSAFGDLFTQQARAVWWNGSYRDLPSLPADTLRAGVLLASTIDRPFTLSAIPYQAAPFAITLPANSWSLVGVPPLATDSVPTIAQSHPWGVFRLEDLDGVVQDATVANSVLQVSYQGGPASTQPFLLSGGTYTRAAVLNAGTAYWIPNYSSTAYRLVRTDGTGPGRFSSLALAGASALRTASATTATATVAATPLAARSGPPAPPGGAAPAPAAEGGGGGCGGGLAGLLLASLALLGLRSRRRS